MPMIRARFFVLALSALVSAQADAFSLDIREVNEYFGRSKAARSRIPFLDGNTPIHERLTDEALECGKPGGLCEQLEAKGIRAADIREGVRSNDFPAQYLDSQSAPGCMGRVLRITIDSDVACILGSFVRAAGNKEKFADRKWSYARPFGMRGHFGDLQFLHAMAPEGQEASDTYAGIQMWMEFAYRASRDEFDLRSDAYAAPVKGMQDHFLRGSRKVGDLLNYRFKKSQARGVALGQMLHIAQDSFAGCHAERDKDGRIIRFLSYGKQSSSEHSKYDGDPSKVQAALAGPLNPVGFAKELLALRVNDKPWAEVDALIKRYFEPVNGAIKSVAGAHCE